MDGSTLILRPAPGRWMAGCVAAVATFGIVSLAVQGEPRDLLRYGPGLLCFAALVWVAYWNPAVEIAPSGVTVRNVFRTIELPWPAIQRVETRHALTLVTAYGRYTAWAAPAPGRSRARDAANADLRGLPDSTFGAGTSVRLGDIPTSPSGEAAAIIRSRWENLHDAGHLDHPRLERDRACTRVHWRTVGLLAALAALTVVGIAVTHHP